MLGVELRALEAIALVVDDEGRVVARGASGGPDLAVAVLAALDEASAGSSPGAPVPGVAAVQPDSAAAAAAMGALGRRFGGSFTQEAPMVSGVAAAAAEAWVGAARGAGDVVYFSAAEHVTAGLLRHGAPMPGAHGRAPAIAWLALNPVEREDYRRVGCLEAEVAAAGLVRRLIWRIKSGDRSRVQEMAGGDLTAVTVDHILDAARGGDGVSISVMRDTAKYLGMAAANLVAIADPETLVLGGIMASAPDLLLETVRVEVSRRLPPAMAQALTIVPGTLGRDAAAIGAARLAAS